MVVAVEIRFVFSHVSLDVFILISIFHTKFLELLLSHAGHVVAVPFAELDASGAEKFDRVLDIGDKFIWICLIQCFTRYVGTQGEVRLIVLIMAHLPLA